MADNESNANNALPGSGDVLGSSGYGVGDNRRVLNRIAESVSNIEKTTSDSIDYLKALVDASKKSGAGSFYSKADEKANGTSRSSSGGGGGFTTNSFRNSTKKTGNPILDQVLEGFEESIYEKLGVGDLDKTLQDVQENLAEALGTTSDDLVKTIVKGMTDAKLDDLSKSNSPLAKGSRKFADFYVGGLKDALNAATETFNKEILNSDLDEGTKSKLTTWSLTRARSQGAEEEQKTEAGKNGVPGAQGAAGVQTVKNMAVQNLAVQNLAIQNLGIQNIAQMGTQSQEPFDVSATATVERVPDRQELESGSDVAGLLPSGEGEQGETSTALAKVGEDALGSAKDAMLEEGKNQLANVAKGGASSAGKAASAVGSAGLKAAGSALSAAGPQLIATYLIEGVTNELGKMIDHLSGAFDKLTSGANRWQDTLWANVEESEKRMELDVRSMVEAPFKILEDAANKVYEVWDQALQTITATQGYDKEGLSDLMSAYASRLRDEGLSDVVGTTDVTSMLESILNAGLSGKVAEEFAYQATILNKAIPTEDFTSYAASYASLASSYMALGHSQEEALQYANQQLQLFASNVLTASREVSGGFTTSLTGVSDLFNEIVKISQTAGSSDTSALSSALSIVQAVAGQVSPDVGNALVSQIVSAATGGNDTSLTALRSLAGTGASNTSFLRALAQNPNQVLATMFENLQGMFDKSSDNYMEVAYSLADTFGITADAMARVNWSNLVAQLRSNTASSSALEQNMSLLASGETTTSAESQRLAQINEYMIDEGLAYVLDNEVARQIQQHMWDQELAAEMQKATYAVDFAGGALELVTSIKGFAGGLLNVLTFGLANIGQVAQSGFDAMNMSSDIKAVLEEGKVGKGNAEDLHDLTSYDVTSFSRKPSYMDYWGLPSAYRDSLTASAGSIIASTAMGGLYGVGTPTSAAIKILSSNKYSQSSGASSPSSMYSWASTGKSMLSPFNDSISSASLQGVSALSATDQIASQTNTALSQWMDSMSEFVSEGKSFQEWMDSASSYGFSDAAAAMEESGYTESDLQQAYLQEGTDQAVDQAIENREKEKEFWEAGINWWNVKYPEDWEAWNQKYDLNFATWTTMFADKMQQWSDLYTNTMMLFTENLNVKYSEWTQLYTESVAETHEKLQYANNQFDSEFVRGFLYDWRDYYIGEHTHYREATNFDKSLKTINSEKRQTGEAVLALAKSLTKNYEDLADPTVQTNVLLGQILIVLQSLLTATQSGKGLTLPNALSALGLNINTSNTANK